MSYSFVIQKHTHRWDKHTLNMCIQTHIHTLIRQDRPAGHTLLRGPAWLSPPSSKQADKAPTRECVCVCVKWEQRRRTLGVGTRGGGNGTTPPPTYLPYPIITVPKHPRGDLKEKHCCPLLPVLFPFYPLLRLLAAAANPHPRPPDNTMQLVAPHSLLTHSLSLLMHLYLHLSITLLSLVSVSLSIRQLQAHPACDPIPPAVPSCPLSL